MTPRPKLILGLALAAFFALGATSASAAEPTLTIDPVSAHTITTAHVSGEVQVPAANNATYWCFEYTPEGTASWNGFCYSGLVQPGESIPVEVDLSSLGANQPYEVRLAAIDFAEFNEGSEAFSPVQTFTTDPAPNAPLVELQAPTPSYISAHIQGTLDPEGGNLNSPGNPIPIHWVIELSETGEPGTWFEGSSGDITEAPAEESNPVPVSADPALPQNTTYHYRLRATYAGQQVLTSDATFKTKEVQKPELTIKDASEVSYQRAHFSGTVKLATNDPAFNSSCEFQYATEADFSNAAAVACEPGAGTILASEAQPVAAAASLTGLAPATTYHLRIVAENHGGREETIAPDTFTTLAVAKPSIANLEVSGITAHTAIFTAHINPNAPAAAGSSTPAEEEAFKTRYRFQCEPECPGLEGEVAADDTSHEVPPAEATGLIPGHPYSVVLVAENAGGQESAGPVEFTTEAAEPTIGTTFAAAVSETEATLKAKVNPGGAPTTAHFDYITLQQYEEDGSSFGAGTEETPESEPIGTDAEDHTAQATVTGLDPDTAYRYRVVATNEKSPSGGTAGPTKGFVTTATEPPFSGCPNESLRRENNSTALPDCRAYEQVSPVDKGGYDAIARIPFQQYPVQASLDGEAVAYLGNGSFAGARGSAITDGRLGLRSPHGWQTTDITPPTPQAGPTGGVSVGYDFSADLSRFAIKVPLQILTENAPPGAEKLYNLYTADVGGHYSLVNSKPIESPPPSGCQVDGCFQFYDSLSFAGASADFSHILFEGDFSIEGTGAPIPEPGNSEFFGFGSSLYEGFDGDVRLVGVLPDGQAAAEGSVPGAGAPYASGVNYSANAASAWFDVNRAISADGSRVLFSAASDGVEENEAGQAGMTELYDRIEGKETIEVSAPAPGASPENPAAAPATFWAASTDGSRVFFTSAAELTTASKTGAEGGQDLYEYDFSKPPSQRLSDLTVDTDPADSSRGASVQGVLGASEDGSHVYFVARGDLTGEAKNQAGESAQGGQPNLYLSHGGQLEFITSLGESDSRDWTNVPVQLTSYLTPNGRYLAFKSAKSLPTANFPAGYDNTDQSTGQPDTEVYEYRAESGDLFCVSCDSSGASPTGPAFIGATANFQASSPFHQPRVISDDGSRLFFSSPDPLVRGAESSSAKVYEYEHAAAGSCTREGGCLSLISSGAGSINDVFLDASTDGGDVFLATLSHLTPSDRDNLFDVYDARVKGGFASEVAKPPCEGEGCLGVAGTRPPGSTAASNSFNGPEDGPRHLTCGKGQRKHHRRCVSRKRHINKHHRSHKRRANTNGRAGR